MDRGTASVVQNADDLARWAAKAVIDTDRLIDATAIRPLSPAEQRLNLLMQRELLVRLSQQNTLLGYVIESRPDRGIWSSLRLWWRRNFSA